MTSAEVRSNDHVLPFMRGVALFIVPFLLVAGVAAVRACDELIAGRALAWPLLLGVLAMLAGSAYLWVRYEPRPR